MLNFICKNGAFILLWPRSNARQLPQLPLAAAVWIGVRLESANGTGLERGCPADKTPNPGVKGGSSLRKKGEPLPFNRRRSAPPGEATGPHLMRVTWSWGAAKQG